MTILNQVKSLTKHSAVYTFATFIQRLQGLVLLPILTDPSYLTTKSEFGDYALIYTFIAFMNVLFLYGMDVAFLRYYFLGEHSRQTIYRSAIQVLSITGFFLSVLMFVLAEPVANLIFNEQGYAFFVRIAAAILFFDALCNMPYLILRAEEHSTTYTIIRMGRFILELVLNLFFIMYLKLGVKGILYANLTAAVINLIVLFPFQIKYFHGKYSWNAVKGLLRFGLPMVPNGLAYLIVEISDRYLMPRLLNKEILGEYTANYKLGTVLLLLVIAFRTAWQPFFLKVAKQADAKEIYSRVMTYYIFIAAFVVLAVTMTIEYIVKIPIAPGMTLLGESYWGGVKIIPLILFSYLMFGVYVNLTVGIYIEKKSEWMIIFTGLAALINVSSNFYLMPAYGMMGAALATLLAYFVMMVSIYIANQRLYHISYEYGRIFWIISYLTVALILYYYLDLNIIIRLLLIIGLPVLLSLLGFFKEDEKAYMREIISRYRT
jgi:O-antigen/teichoic acid export membrane protein